jgi:hypothetical protein
MPCPKECQILWWLNKCISLLHLSFTEIVQILPGKFDGWI